MPPLLFRRGSNDRTDGRRPLDRGAFHPQNAMMQPPRIPRRTRHQFRHFPILSRSPLHAKRRGVRCALRCARQRAAPRRTALRSRARLQPSISMIRASYLVKLPPLAGMVRGVLSTYSCLPRILPAALEHRAQLCRLPISPTVQHCIARCAPRARCKAVVCQRGKWRREWTGDSQQLSRTTAACSMLGMDIWFTGSAPAIRMVDLRSSSTADQVRVAPQTSGASLILGNIASSCSINEDAVVVALWPARPTLTSAPTTRVVSLPTSSYCASACVFRAGPLSVSLGKHTRSRVCASSPGPYRCTHTRSRDDHISPGSAVAHLRRRPYLSTRIRSSSHCRA